MRPPVDVVHLFPKVDALLFELLHALQPKDWYKPTLAKKWCVKDVVAHLLDTQLRAISDSQGYTAPPQTQIDSYRELVKYLNDLNAVWVRAMQRVSPQLLIQMLEQTSEAYCRLMAEEPLYEPAKYSVAWAGEETSLNWFHIAREYTEKVHHQLQVRHAVGDEGPLLTKELFYPFIDTLMYGLPHTLRFTTPAENTVILVEVSGPGGGQWFAKFEDSLWQLSKDHAPQPDAVVTLDASTAWKLFTKGLSPTEALPAVELRGNIALATEVLHMVSVMA